MSKDNLINAADLSERAMTMIDTASKIDCMVDR